MHAVLDEPRIQYKPLRLVCSEIWGGNRPMYGPIELPGVRGVLYSQPCDGGRGGDVHYLSVCGSGLLSRMCLADVVGHGETVAAVSDAIHRHLRRGMNRVDQRRVLAELNNDLEAMGLEAMTTAAALTYYPPREMLAVSYAGHPPGWYYHADEDRWARLELDADRRMGRFANAPMAVQADVRYDARKLRVRPGDRMLLVTDGVLETPGLGGEQFGDDGVAAFLDACRDASCESIAESLLDELHARSGGSTLVHDDVSFLVAEFLPVRRMPAFATALKCRLTRPRGNSAGYC